jgi:Protein of unknown function (DUF3179)
VIPPKERRLRVTTDSTPRVSRRPFLLLWILGTSAAVMSVAWELWPTEENPPPSTPARPVYNQSFDAPGIRQPAALPAADVAALSADEPIIGISAGGRNRAYLVRALALGARFHIVNDVLGGVPVSVTYCDLNACTRLFTAADAGEPLDLSQSGLNSGEMVLKSGGHPYFQDSGAPLDADAPPFPYHSYPGDVTTWGSWQREHPDTDIYVGEVPLSPPPQEEVTLLPSQVVARSSSSAFLTSLVYFGAAPLLIVFVTLLVHLLLAAFLSPRRQRGTRLSPPDRSGAANS